MFHHKSTNATQISRLKYDEKNMDTILYYLYIYIEREKINRRTLLVVIALKLAILILVIDHLVAHGYGSTTGTFLTTIP